MNASRTVARILRTTLVPAVCVASAAMAADDAPMPSSEVQRAVTRAQLSPESRKIAHRLEETLADGSEARAMLETILSGEPLGPESGWWGVAKAQSRFDWPRVGQRYDADGNGAVDRQEFSGSAIELRRIDADGNGVVTEADFERTRQTLEKTAGFWLFVEADADADGKVTREEFAALFDRWDDGSLGFLAPADLRHRLPESERKTRGRGRHGGPSVETLLRGLAEQEIGSLQPGPNLEEKAPDFTLSRIDGADSITLSERVGEKPVVLIFGNFTCGPFRRQSGNMQKLHARYGDRAEFLMVYVREAHPSDGWASSRNAQHGIEVVQPTTDQQRREVAARCAEHLDLPFPVLVDRVDDRVGTRYSGMPNRLYLIDRDGKIAFKSGRGPFGFKPRQLEQALVLLLNAPAPTTAKAAEGDHEVDELPNEPHGELTDER